MPVARENFPLGSNKFCEAKKVTVQYSTSTSTGSAVQVLVLLYIALR